MRHDSKSLGDRILSPSCSILADVLTSESSIGYIRYLWADLFGVLRVRVLHKAHSMHIAREHHECAHQASSSSQHVPQILRRSAFQWLAPTNFARRLDDACRVSVSGLLRRLPKLCAVTISAHNSYNRVTRLNTRVPGGWGSQNYGTGSQWGRCQVGVDDWELRFVDDMASIYSILGAYFLAGTMGVRRREGAAMDEFLARKYLELPQGKRTKTDVGA